jgi:hypothetical protein
VSTSSLSISNVQQTDSGSYVCRAADATGTVVNSNTITLDTIIAVPTKLSFWLIRSQENAPPSKYYIVGKKLLRAYFFVVASIDFVFKYIS